MGKGIKRRQNGDGKINYRHIEIDGDTLLDLTELLISLRWPLQTTKVTFDLTFVGPPSEPSCSIVIYLSVCTSLPTS